MNYSQAKDTLSSFNNYQIKDDDYQFVIGDYCGNIRVNSTLEYFLSEASYRPESELSQNKLIDLKVRTLSNDFVCHSELLPSDSGGVYMLDIDLDFFSTYNPFIKIYEKAGVYAKLKKIFAFSWPEKLEQSDEVLAKVKDRENQLNELEKLFQYVADNGSLGGINIPEILKPVWSQINDLVTDVQANYDDVKWTVIYDAGCTCDNTDLPHHESSLKEISLLVDQFKQFLRGLQLPPTIITVSRSSYDDYCPADQVEDIQEKVLSACALKDVYGGKLTDQPIHHYKDEEWNI